ncbi:hypothetical protein K435DRAFT_776110 [Dendrothele bispora CBS 962.96]|uniref:Uncharacterized protein n=1 Tax=Dendrothele bispora (strain CBS 962.96) TaxID=1314807 RepID=A0A4V4HH37_DENBC|nr:hypothetical protein K435DRAFT_776110 [Dendrothele bispora CBS 962.96]
MSQHDSSSSNQTQPSAPSQPSIFTLLTRLTYIPPSSDSPSPSSPPTPTRRSTKDLRSGGGVSVDPSVLDALFVLEQPVTRGSENAEHHASTTTTTTSSSAAVSSTANEGWLNLTTIAQDPVFTTPAGAFDGIDRIVRA